jgi:hypothetical protein
VVRIDIMIWNASFVVGTAILFLYGVIATLFFTRDETVAQRYTVMFGLTTAMMVLGVYASLNMRI